MNKAEVVAKVSEMSGVSPEVCGNVLKALEKVLQKELGDSKGLSGALDKITGLMNFLGSGKSGS